MTLLLRNYFHIVTTYSWQQAFEKAQDWEYIYREKAEILFRQVSWSFGWYYKNSSYSCNILILQKEKEKIMLTAECGMEFYFFLKQYTRDFCKINENVFIRVHGMIIKVFSIIIYSEKFRRFLFNIFKWEFWFRKLLEKLKLLRSFSYKRNIIRVLAKLIHRWKRKPMIR